MCCRHDVLPGQSFNKSCREKVNTCEDTSYNMNWSRRRIRSKYKNLRWFPLNTISGSSKSSNLQHLQNQTSHLGCPTRPCHRTVNDIQTAKGRIRAVGSYWFTVYTGKCKLSWSIPMTEHKIWCLLFGCPFLSHLCWMWLCPGRWVKSWFLCPKMFGFRMLLRIKVVRCANENPKYTVHEN